MGAHHVTSESAAAAAAAEIFSRHLSNSRRCLASLADGVRHALLDDSSVRCRKQVSSRRQRRTRRRFI